MRSPVLFPLPERHDSKNRLPHGGAPERPHRGRVPPEHVPNSSGDQGRDQRSGQARCPTHARPPGQLRRLDSGGTREGPRLHPGRRRVRRLDGQRPREHPLQEAPDPGPERAPQVLGLQVRPRAYQILRCFFQKDAYVFAKAYNKYTAGQKKSRDGFFSYRW